MHNGLKKKMEKISKMRIRENFKEIMDITTKLLFSRITFDEELFKKIKHEFFWGFFCCVRHGRHFFCACVIVSSREI